MKKPLAILLLACLLLTLLAACGKKKGDDDAFEPALDTTTSCSITVAGSYDNFEALEAEVVPQAELHQGQGDQTGDRR